MEYYELLEEQLGKWCGRQNVVAVSTGTAALHLALEALQLPQGSKVAVPEFSMVACARAVTMAGLVPVFIDCNDDLLIDPNQLETVVALDASIRAVMPVHIYGRRCDMDRIAEIATRYDLRVIEDLAEGHGIPIHPGSYAGCWSFYRNKIVHAEEGGAIAYRSGKQAEITRMLRCQGFTDRHDFTHVPRGVNARMTNSQAEIILDSLEDIENNLRLRREVSALYDAKIPERWRMPARQVDWVYDIRIPGLAMDDQDKIVRHLNRLLISARHGFKPLSSQPEYLDGRYEKTNAYRLSQEVLYLPCIPGMEEHDVKTVCAALSDIALQLGIL